MPLASWADYEATVEQYQTKRPEVKVLLEGEFTLIKSNSRTVEDTRIYDALSKCLSTSNLHPDSITLIKDKASDQGAVIAKAFENSPKFCGEYMKYDPRFMYRSVASGRNGVLLWEHQGRRVGIITYRYRDLPHNDVYIDGICMNQEELFQGGGQLLKFFIQCLASANFKHFSLRSVRSSVKFFTDNGFIADFFDPDDRYIDEYGGPHWPMFTHMSLDLESNKTRATKANKNRARLKNLKKMYTTATPATQSPRSTTLGRMLSRSTRSTKLTPATKSTRSTRSTRAMKSYRQPDTIADYSSRRPRRGGSSGTRKRRDNAGPIMPQYKKTSFVKLKHKRRSHKRTN
jgi:hypothetical protein